MDNWRKWTHFVYILMGLSWLVSLLLTLDCIAVLRDWPIAALPADAWKKVESSLEELFGARQWLPVLLFAVFSFFWGSSAWALFIGRSNRRLRIVWQVIVVMFVIVYSGGLAVFLLHDVINESLYSKFIFLIFLSIPLTLMSGIGIGVLITEAIEKATQDTNYGLIRAAEILRDIQIRPELDLIELTPVETALESCQAMVRDLDQNFATEGRLWHSMKAMHRYPRLFVKLTESTLLLQDAIAGAYKGVQGNIRDELQSIDELVPGKNARMALIASRLSEFRSKWLRSLMASTIGADSASNIER